MELIKSSVLDKRFPIEPFTQSVILEGKTSKPHPVLSGVPQGTVLATLLFLLYINDITKLIKSTIRLYVDDILMCRVIDLVDDHYSL